MRAWILVASLTLMTVHSAAAGTITYTAQGRRVAAVAGQLGGASNGEVKDAPDFAPWSEMASALYGNINGSAAATATQVSILDVDVGITLSGGLSASADVGFVGNAQSLFGVSFSLAADTPYVSTLSGSANITAFSFGSSGSGTLTFAANSSGILPAGDYSLQINHREASVGGSVSGGYSYSLTVPEPSTVVLSSLAFVGLLAYAWRVTPIA